MPGIGGWTCFSNTGACLVSCVFEDESHTFVVGCSENQKTATRKSCAFSDV